MIEARCTDTHWHAVIDGCITRSRDACRRLTRPRLRLAVLGIVGIERHAVDAACRGERCAETSTAHFLVCRCEWCGGVVSTTSCVICRCERRGGVVSTAGLKVQGLAVRGVSSGRGEWCTVPGIVHARCVRRVRGEWDRILHPALVDLDAAVLDVTRGSGQHAVWLKPGVVNVGCCVLLVLRALECVAPQYRVL